MNYYLDTEFLEGSQKKRFLGFPYSKTVNTIDLISVGIVCEDGREYYAISKDFNLKEAWNRYDIKIVNDGRNELKVYWIRNNVLKPIFYELMGKDIAFHDIDDLFTYKKFKSLIKKLGQHREQIKQEILNFTSVDESPSFYTYYGAYDWVVFCWIFGKMIDLPKSYPMYCNDLKQELDDKVIRLGLNLTDVKKMHNYPDNSNEHNALDDAKWNLKLHQFIRKL